MTRNVIMSLAACLWLAACGGSGGPAEDVISEDLAGDAEDVIEADPGPDTGPDTATEMDLGTDTDSDTDVEVDLETDPGSDPDADTGADPDGEEAPTECTPDEAAACDDNATCVIEGGSPVCICNDGWTGTGTTCADIDECTEGTDNCHLYETCTNTEGSFTCTCSAIPVVATQLALLDTLDGAGADLNPTVAQCLGLYGDMDGEDRVYTVTLPGNQVLWVGMTGLADNYGLYILEGGCNLGTDTCNGTDFYDANRRECLAYHNDTVSDVDLYIGTDFSSDFASIAGDFLMDFIIDDNATQTCTLTGTPPTPHPEDHGTTDNNDHPDRASDINPVPLPGASRTVHGIIDYYGLETTTLPDEGIDQDFYTFTLDTNQIPAYLTFNVAADTNSKVIPYVVLIWRNEDGTYGWQRANYNTGLGSSVVISHYFATAQQYWVLVGDIRNEDFLMNYLYDKNCGIAFGGKCYGYVMTITSKDLTNLTPAKVGCNLGGCSGLPAPANRIAPDPFGAALYDFTLPNDSLVRIDIIGHSTNTKDLDPIISLWDMSDNSLLFRNRVWFLDKIFLPAGDYRLMYRDAQDRGGLDFSAGFCVNTITISNLTFEDEGNNDTTPDVISNNPLPAVVAGDFLWNTFDTISGTYIENEDWYSINPTQTGLYNIFITGSNNIWNLNMLDENNPNIWVGNPAAIYVYDDLGRVIGYDLPDPGLAYTFYPGVYSLPLTLGITYEILVKPAIWVEDGQPPVLFTDHFPYKLVITRQQDYPSDTFDWGRPYDIYLNEVFPKVRTGTPSDDTNLDGGADSSEDEFVEILIDNTWSSLDLSGYMVRDLVCPRHQFANATHMPYLPDINTLAVVLFGGFDSGYTPDPADFGNALVLAASAQLGLGNSGDVFVLINPDGFLFDRLQWGDIAYGANWQRDLDSGDWILEPPGDASNPNYTPGYKNNTTPSTGQFLSLEPPCVGAETHELELGVAQNGDTSTNPTDNFMIRFSCPMSGGDLYQTALMGPLEGPDNVYVVDGATLNSANSYAITVTPTGFDVALWRLSSCEDYPFGEYCEEVVDTIGTDPEVISLINPQARLYYFIVDSCGTDCGSGAYTIVLEQN